MKPITYEEAAKRAYNPTAYKDGYNTAVELANREIESAYSDGFNSMVECAKEQIIDLTADRDYWKGLCTVIASDKEAEIQRLKDLMKCKAAVSKPDLTDDVTLIQGLIKRIERLEQQIKVDEQAQDTLYKDIKDLRRKIKKSKSNSWTQTVDNAIHDLMPVLSETICELKLKVESLEKQVEILCDNAETDSQRIEKLEAYIDSLMSEHNKRVVINLSDKSELLGMIEKLESESHDETTRYLALLQKVEKLEQGAVMDGERIGIGGFGHTKITKIK